ncbi:MAG: 30S ribosomal protein S21 [Actinobacteria bacterium]|nr:30S ribosomal protein S21 [Actinomycetota bacterium]
MAKQEKRPGESIDSMLRKFKRKVKNEGTLQELRSREHFEKPSETKKRRAKAARRRTEIQQQADELY